MTRLNVALSSTPFSWPLRVYYEDTDAQGVVYYANYFKFMERARTEWIRSLGVEQDELLTRQRRLFVVVRTEAEFLKPARFNDSVCVTAALARRARASFVISQSIYRDTIEGELLCTGIVKVAYIDADSSRPVKLPDSLLRETTYEH